MSLDFDLYTIVLSKNISQRFIDIAHSVELYDCIWEPENNGYLYAKELIIPLMSGLQKLENTFEYYKIENEIYKDFAKIVTDILEHCRMFPDSRIRAWR